MRFTIKVESYVFSQNPSLSSSNLDFACASHTLELQFCGSAQKESCSAKGYCGVKSTTKQGNCDPKRNTLVQKQLRQALLKSFQYKSTKPSSERHLLNGAFEAENMT